MSVKGFSVLVLVLDWTPTAMMRGRMTGFPKKTGGPDLRRGRIRWIQFAQFLLPVAHHPRAGCIRLVQCTTSCPLLITSSSFVSSNHILTLSTHLLAFSLNFSRSSKVQGCANNVGILTYAWLYQEPVHTCLAV